MVLQICRAIMVDGICVSCSSTSVSATDDGLVSRFARRVLSVAHLNIWCHCRLSCTVCRRWWSCISVSFGIVIFNEIIQTICTYLDRIPVTALPFGSGVSLDEKIGCDKNSAGRSIWTSWCNSWILSCGVLTQSIDSGDRMLRSRSACLLCT
jgi:hypothetical protein